MKNLFLKILITACLGIILNTSARDTIKEVPDITFIEIHLSDEGVVGIDTSGEHWFYDFNEDYFIQGDQNLSRGENTDFERLRAEVEIENRAVYELKISNLEKSVQVGFDEFVDGDIVALGKVTIRGWVKGDVKSLTDRVLITNTGRVEGDIEAPKIVIKDEAIVMGDVIETNNPLDFEGLVDTFTFDGIIIVASFTLFFLLLTYLVAFLMPKKLSNFKECMQKYKMRTYFIGLLFLILLPALVLLLAITIVGIVLIPLVPFIYLFAIFMGVIAFGNILGENISTNFKTNLKSVFSISIVGVLILMILWMSVAVLLGSSDSVSVGFGILFLVISIIISTIPILSGIGAALLTRFGFRNYTSINDTVKDINSKMPTPPPIPTVPTGSEDRAAPDHNLES